MISAQHLIGGFMKSIRLIVARCVLVFLFLQCAMASSFITAPSYPASSSPQAIAVADFNLDGLPDIAVADTASVVDVLLAKSDGTFQSPLTFSLPAAATGIAAGDFTHDGYPDLAVSGPFLLNFTVLIGK